MEVSKIAIVIVCYGLRLDCCIVIFVVIIIVFTVITENCITIIAKKTYIIVFRTIGRQEIENSPGHGPSVPDP